LFQQNIAKRFKKSV